VPGVKERILEMIQEKTVLNAKPTKILLIEDNPVQIIMIKAML